MHRDSAITDNNNNGNTSNRYNNDHYIDDANNNHADCVSNHAIDCFSPFRGQFTESLLCTLLQLAKRMIHGCIGNDSLGIRKYAKRYQELWPIFSGTYQ